LDDAIAILRQRAKLPSVGDTTLVPFPPRRSVLEVLTSTSVDSAADAAIEKRAWKALGLPPSYALRAGGILRLFPYQLSIQ